MKLSDRIQNLSESQTIAMSQKSRELRAQGIDVINLSLGEPDFDTPDFAKAAANQAIADNFTHYMPVPGFLDLREAIAHKFKRDNGLDFKASQIVVSTGAKQSITNVVLSLVNPGEEVLLPAPFWVSYREIVKLAEGTPVVVSTNLENDFKVTAEQLDAAIGGNTRMIIFSSPCNPTGSAYSGEELAAMAQVLEKYPDVYVICDEIYEHIRFEGTHVSLASFEAIRDRVITVNGVSKAFAMTGWRIGYLGAAQWIADACTKMQGQVTSGTCSIAQKAAKAAVAADPSVCDSMVEAFRNRRGLILELAKAIPSWKVNQPIGAFYLFPDVSANLNTRFGDTEIHNATDLCMYLLNEAHVAVVPGEAFGSPGYLRISYAASDDQIREAMQRIKKAIDRLEPLV